MGAVMFLILFSPVAAITGGVAGAIVGGGSEDRPIWQNAVIGIVGWTVAWLLIGVFTGRWLEELTFWFGGLALLVSMVFVLVDAWWTARSQKPTE